MRSIDVYTPEQISELYALSDDIKSIRARLSALYEPTVAGIDYLEDDEELPLALMGLRKDMDFALPILDTLARDTRSVAWLIDAVSTPEALRDIFGVE